MNYEPIEEEVKRVNLATISFDDDLQVRKKMQRATVDKYANVLRNKGEVFPPVTLANIGNGELVMVDGWHRAQAYEQVGYARVPAVVHRMNRSKAQWEAAQANLEHGLPLKSAEHREVFRAYVSAGKHKSGAGVKSSREIAKELGGHRAHATILNWMKKDYPSIYRKMAKDDDRSGEEHEDAVSKGPTPGDVLAGALETAHRVPLEELSNDERSKAVQDAEILLGSLKASGPYSEDYVEDEGNF